MGAATTCWRDPLGLQRCRRPRPPLTLCTTAWDEGCHGRPAAKGVLQRSGGGPFAQGEPAGTLAEVGRRAVNGAMGLVSGANFP